MKFPNQSIPDFRPRLFGSNGTADGIRAFRRCPNAHDTSARRLICPRVLPRRAVIQMDEDENMFLSTAQLPMGRVYHCSLYSVHLESMPDTDYGMVNLGRKPFRITLNANMTFPRIQMSLVHELLHIFCAMYKIDLSHEQLHVLALLIDNDILPSLAALARFANNSGKQT